MQYEIRTDVPMPERVKGRKPRREWPFKRMNIGACVYFHSYEFALAQRAAHSYGKITGKKFITAQDKTERGGGEIWREA